MHISLFLFKISERYRMNFKLKNMVVVFFKRNKYLIIIYILNKNALY